jgi:hypothetical protein
MLNCTPSQYVWLGLSESHWIEEILFQSQLNNNFGTYKFPVNPSRPSFE